MNKYEIIETYLHTEEAKAMVKSGNWHELANALLPFFSEKDSGAIGKIWEIIVKLYLNGYKGNSCIVSAKGKVDVMYKGYKLEVKSNCGQLGSDIHKNDFIVYTMDNHADVATPEGGRVETVDGFFQMLENTGLLRTSKKQTNGMRGMAIQSYKNSKRKTLMLIQELSTFQFLEDWKAWADENPKRK